MYRVTSDSSSDQNPHGWHRTTCESSLPTTTRVKSPPSPLTSDGFVAKRLEKIAKEVESIIVSQHFSSFDQEVPTHKHQPHHFHEIAKPYKGAVNMMSKQLTLLCEAKGVTVSPIP
ncbi:hypothetical protein Bca52824_048857 [Brassica carinata]|uniref:Uncharacterized protein n=1 Tax=Brassica carinata TaxID=52824 RepID=A0A8X7RHD8_BRACI|nr:hypothetical protein Bca52824_048857 [Brassica carinata]